MLKKIAMLTALGAVGVSLLVPCYAATPVKIATVAPAADLAAAADARVKLLEESLKDNDEYNKAKAKTIPAEASVLAVLAQAIADDRPLLVAYEALRVFTN